MKTQTLLAIFALTSAVAAAPLPSSSSGSSTSTSAEDSLGNVIEGLVGSPSGNGNGQYLLNVMFIDIVLTYLQGMEMVRAPATDDSPNEWCLGNCSTYTNS